MMKFSLIEDKFHVRAFFAPCSCSCNFCCLGDYPKDKRIIFDDYEMILRKFSDIKSTHSMRLRSFIYNCIEHSMLDRQTKLFYELGMDPIEFTQFDINGTRIKTSDELETWFDSLIGCGMERAAFSWFGLESSHDRFVNCSGYFKYLMNCVDMARRKNIPVVSKVFFHREVLNEAEQLIKLLEPVSDHIIGAMMEYSGRAKKMESAFLTSNDVDNMSASVKKHFQHNYMKKFLPESKWIELVLRDDFPVFKLVDYILYLDADNIEYVKHATVDEILDNFRANDVKLQRSFNTIRELALRYGNCSCNILYECRDILKKWLDLYYHAHNYNTKDLFSFTNSSVEWKVYERLHANE